MYESLWPHGLQHSELHYLLQLAQTHSHPLPPPSPCAFNLSRNRGLFQWVSSSHQVAKVSEFQLQHRSFQWIFRLISFRIDWCDLLAVQGTLRSLLQHHNSKTSIIWCSTFFVVHLSQYMITGEVRLIIPFLPRSKHLLISWLWTYIWTFRYYLFICISCLCEYHTTLINVAL